MQPIAAMPRLLGNRSPGQQGGIGGRCLLFAVSAAIGRADGQSPGQIDILVNNAGINKDNLVLRISDEEWDQVLKTNLYGALYCSRAAVKHMVRRRYGRIVSISSVVGVSGNAEQVHRAASNRTAGVYHSGQEYGVADNRQCGGARLYTERYDCTA